MTYLFVVAAGANDDCIEWDDDGDMVASKVCCHECVDDEVQRNESCLNQE